MSDRGKAGRPRAFLFDFDGVIADSEPMHQRGLKAAVESLGLRFFDEQVNGVWSGAYIGLDDRACFALIYRQNGLEMGPEDFEHLSRLKREAVQRAFDEGELQPFEGVVGLIRAASGVAPAAICSGARRHEIEPLVRHFGVAEHVPTIVSSDDVAVAKPDPAGYLLTCRRLGVEPRHAVTIEDSPRGIAAARAAGVPVVAVGHSFGPERLAEADAFVPHVRDLTVDRLSSLWSEAVARRAAATPTAGR